jgi:predicted ArsR family transcriptional regulator
VDELARSLGVTDNAVRAHLAALQRDGIVARAGSRPTGRKPAVTYRLTDEGERLFPKAYGLILVRLLDALHGKLRAAEVAELLTGIGRRLGRAQRVAGRAGADEPLDRRLETVVEVFRGLGGVPVLEPAGDGYVLRGAGCPLAEAVREHPEVCGLAEALVEELTGLPVRERCEREGTPRCRFEIAVTRGDADAQKSYVSSTLGSGGSLRGDAESPGAAESPDAPARESGGLPAKGP